MNASRNGELNTHAEELAEFEAPLRLIPAAVVRELIDVMGSKAVSRLAGVRNTRSVYHWLNGEREPERLHVLRFTLQIVSLMRSAGETSETVLAWLTGMNPRLEGAAPIELLSENDTTDVRKAVFVAAQSFARKNGHSS